MRLRRLILAISWLAIAAKAGHAAEPELSAPGKRAFDRLLGAKWFQGAAIGRGGRLSPNAAAVRALIKEKNADAAFQLLFDRAATVGKLYALTAFWYLRPTEFQGMVAEVRKAHAAESVPTMFGCEDGQRTVGDLLQRHGPNAVRLAPGTELYQWACGSARQTSFEADISGGMLPIEIVEGTLWTPGRRAHPPPKPSYLTPRR